jgi:glucosyl-dolichyl phosphate glucuronosyltransferase
MSADISVVICAHDPGRWRQLQAALQSVAGQDHRPGEVILVVDHNPSLLARARRELGGVIVVENCELRGLGGARNSGIRAASGAVVAFLDDDAIASPDWLTALAEQYADPAVAGVGGSIDPVWEGGRPRWFPSEFHWVVGCSYRGMPEATQEVRNLFGCNMSFRREVLNALGRFRLGYGCDETELCIRVRQRWPSKKLVYVPEGRVLHHVPVDRARVQYFLARCYFEGGSKAVVATLVGARAGLASERHYTRRTLPLAVGHGVGEFLHRGNVDGLTRATMVIAGLTTTTLGFISGGLSTSRAARRRGWSGELVPRSPRTRRRHSERSTR